MVCLLLNPDYIYISIWFVPFMRYIFPYIGVWKQNENTLWIFAQVSLTDGMLYIKILWYTEAARLDV